MCVIVRCVLKVLLCSIRKEKRFLMTQNNEPAHRIWYLLHMNNVILLFRDQTCFSMHYYLLDSEGDVETQA